MNAEQLMVAAAFLTLALFGLLSCGDPARDTEPTVAHVNKCRGTVVCTREEEDYDCTCSQEWVRPKTESWRY